MVARPVPDRRAGPHHPLGAGFMLAYALPLVLLASAGIGELTGYASVAAFIPLLVIYLAVPVLHESIGSPVEPPCPTAGASVRWWRFYRALPRWGIPVQAVALCVAAQHFTSPELSGAGKIAWLASCGVFGALFAINIGHELIHRRDPLDRLLGGVLLSLVGYGAFKIVHLKVHHRHVGTPADPATAPRGESLYRFWARNLACSFSDAWRIEWHRSRRFGRPFWRSEFVLWYGLSAAWCGLAFAVWGWMGVVFFVAQSLIAILKLDWINYLQHYGLVRKPVAGGAYEPVQAHHAWCQEHLLTNLALLNLMRHGDHHANPHHPYQGLEHRVTGPKYPYDFSIMCLLALVPQTFARVVHPVLDRESGAVRLAQPDS